MITSKNGIVLHFFFCDPRGDVLPLGYRLCSIVTILHADNSTTLTLHAY